MNKKFTTAALECIHETGADVNDDIDALRTGAHTRESLLAYCLDGAESDRVQGWHDYVSEVARLAEVAS